MIEDDPDWNVDKYIEFLIKRLPPNTNRKIIICENPQNQEYNWLYEKFKLPEEIKEE